MTEIPTWWARNWSASMPAASPASSGGTELNGTLALSISTPVQDGFSAMSVTKPARLLAGPSEATSAMALSRMPLSRAWVAAIEPSRVATSGQAQASVFCTKSYRLPSEYLTMSTGGWPG